VAAVNVEWKVRAEENERFGVTELGPVVVWIQTIVIENADFACDFANHMIFLHGIQGLNNFPGRMFPANVNCGISDGIRCQRGPARFIKSGIGPVEGILSPAIGHPRQGFRVLNPDRSLSQEADVDEQVAVPVDTFIIMVIETEEFLGVQGNGRSGRFGRTRGDRGGRTAFSALGGKGRHTRKGTDGRRGSVTSFGLLSWGLIASPRLAPLMSKSIHVAISDLFLLGFGTRALLPVTVLTLLSDPPLALTLSCAPGIQRARLTVDAVVHIRHPLVRVIADDVLPRLTPFAENCATIILIK
jgi:hypothetical protein